MTRGPGRLTITPLPAKEAREVYRQVWAAIAANIAAGAPLVEPLDLFVRAYAARKARRPGRPAGTAAQKTRVIRDLYGALRRLGADRAEAVDVLARRFELDMSTVYRCTKLR